MSAFSCKGQWAGSILSSSHVGWLTSTSENVQQAVDPGRKVEQTAREASGSWREFDHVQPGAKNKIEKKKKRLLLKVGFEWDRWWKISSLWFTEVHLVKGKHVNRSQVIYFKNYIDNSVGGASINLQPCTCWFAASLLHSSRKKHTKLGPKSVRQV